ncbi:MAG: hypothetical protein ACRDE2_13660 [Chitinophagaceae bacterium]
MKTESKKLKKGPLYFKKVIVAKLSIHSSKNIKMGHFNEDTGTKCSSDTTTVGTITTGLTIQITDI